MEKKVKILIVDDNVNFANTTRDLLNEKGYDSICVNSGKEAVEKVRDAVYDAILLDMKMPVMDGVDTYREIKKIRPQSLVVLVTAYRVEELISEALAEGAYALFIKPLDIDNLLKTIERGRKGGALILVVDDDPNVCEAVKDNLEERGFVVSTALSGEEAIRIAEKRHHEVVLIDVKIPPLNGLIIYMEMKKINPDVIAVMMTAHRDDTNEVVEEALERGVFTCLYKPFNIDEVISTIEKAVIKKREEVSNNVG